jgi:hypothetical protein
VFMSFNFEANYALPTQASHFTQGLYDKIFFISGVDRNESTARMEAINFFSRYHFYQIIEDKMDSLGMNGKDCLLKLICEASRADFISNNGIFGSIIHIILS